MNLICRKTLSIICSFAVILGLSACSSSGDAEKDAAKESAPLVESEGDYSGKWNDFSVLFDENQIVFPCKGSEFERATAFSFKDNRELSPNEKVFDIEMKAPTKKVGKLMRVTVGVINQTNDKISIKDADVWSVDFEAKRGYEASPAVGIIGDIVLGKSKIEDVETAYGVPLEDNIWSDNGGSYLSYDYPTEDDDVMSLSFLNGVLNSVKFSRYSIGGADEQ